METPESARKIDLSSGLAAEIAEAVSGLIGAREWSGDKPFEVGMANQEEGSAYIYQIRRGESWITISERSSKNPSLVLTFHLRRKGGEWSYDDPYLAKYGTSSLGRLQEAYERLKIAIEASAPEQLDEEEKPEHIPTSEEVLALFEKLAGGTEYETFRKLEDEKGLYLWEIKIPQKNGSLEYSYIRKGNYREKGLPGGSAAETAIHVTYFDDEGIPTSGQSVFKLIGDKWIETP